MNDVLSNKSLQPLYAAAILLLLLCTAPILSGPRGYGMNMYTVLKMGGNSLLGIYMWINLIVSAIFILLAIPAVLKKVDEKTQGMLRLISSAVLAFFMIVTLINLRHLAWGWGLWLIIILTVLLVVNVYMNRKANRAQEQ